MGNSVVFIEFFGTKFEGAELYPETPGFLCPGMNDQRSCVGHTGEQILSTLHLSFDVVDSEDRRGHNLKIMVAMALVCKALYGVIFFIKCAYKRKIIRVEVPEREQTDQEPEQEHQREEIREATVPPEIGGAQATVVVAGPPPTPPMVPSDTEAEA